MARGWRVLDASAFEGTIGGAPGRLIFTKASGVHDEVPAADVAVVLLGTRASISASALFYLAKYDIATLACDWRGVPLCGVHPWTSHGRVAARQIAQAELSLPKKKSAWMQLVQAKILGQASVLSAVDDMGGDFLRALARRVRSGDPQNVEAQAARFYWARLFGEFRRDQDAGDDINAMLNYGYMVLRGFGIRGVLAAGLSPTLGVFHRGRGNYFNLVDDLVEPFRPAVDHVVAHMDEFADLSDPLIKSALVSAASQPFSQVGHRIPKVLEDLAQQVGDYVEGEAKRLHVLAWNGPVRAVEDAEA